MFNLCYLIVFCLFPIDLIDKKVILKIPIYKAINLFFQMSPFFRVDPGVWCGVVWCYMVWCYRWGGDGKETLLPYFVCY